MKTIQLSCVLGAATLAGALLGQMPWLAPALAAGPTPEQLAAEVTALKSRLTQLESRSRTTAPPAPATTDTALAALQKDVAALTQVLQVSGNSVTLKSPGSIVVDAGNALQLKAASQATIDAGASLKLRGGADLEASSSGAVSVKGAKVAFNNGTRPVAFAGGKTAGTANSQLIAEGSATVLVP